jgi:hypothetical protein
MKRRAKTLQLKKSKKVVGMPTLKHQASRTSLLLLKVHGTPATMVLLASPTPTLLLKVVLQQSPPSLPSLKTLTSHTQTTLLSKLQRKWQLSVSWSLDKPMRARSRTRNGRMPRS